MSSGLHMYRDVYRALSYRSAPNLRRRTVAISGEDAHDAKLVSVLQCSVEGGLPSTAGLERRRPTIVVLDDSACERCPGAVGKLAVGLARDGWDVVVPTLHACSGGCCALERCNRDNAEEVTSTLTALLSSHHAARATIIPTERGQLAAPDSAVVVLARAIREREPLRVRLATFEHGPGPVPAPRVLPWHGPTLERDCASQPVNCGLSHRALL